MGVVTFIRMEISTPEVIDSENHSLSKVMKMLMYIKLYTTIQK